MPAGSSRARPRAIVVVLLAAIAATAAPPSAAQSTLLPAAPGRLQEPAVPLEVELRMERDADLALHLDSAGLHAVQRAFRGFAEVFTAQPMFRQPRLFHTVLAGTVLGGLDGGTADPGTPVPGRLLVGALGVDLGFAELAYRRRRQGGAEDHMLDIRLNLPDLARGRPVPQLPATYMRQPRETGRIGGQPIFEGSYVVVTARDPSTLWRPVATGQVLREYLQVIEAGRANADRQLAAAVRLAEERPDSARLAAANPSSASPEGRWYWSWHEAGDALRARLEAMSPEEADLPACLLDRSEAETAAQYRLVALRGTPRCAPIVQVNPGFLRRDLPRWTVQVALFGHVGFCMRTMREFTPQLKTGLRSGCAAVLKMMSEADWGAVHKLLDR
ncbi:MAG: hypothetical protein HYX65_00300 [Gemmatimonadetes bacterium]|nr:hypothetical protein [Gemmatimonadota bacterium]